MEQKVARFRIKLHLCDSVELFVCQSDQKHSEFCADVREQLGLAENSPFTVSYMTRDMGQLTLKSTAAEGKGFERVFAAISPNSLLTVTPMAQPVTAGIRKPPSQRYRRYPKSWHVVTSRRSRR